MAMTQYFNIYKSIKPYHRSKNNHENQMVTNESSLYHEYLIRLDDELSQKLMHFAKENDMTLTGTVRKSLRQFFQNEESGEPAIAVKNNDPIDENINR
jgi:hypothetical protein